MAQHKTIDRRKAEQKKSAPVPAQRNQTTAASAQAGREHRVIDRRQTGQKQTTSVPTAPARGQSAGGGGYYSPREYGVQTGAYEARVTAARAEMEQRSEAMRRAQQALEQLNAQVQEKRSRYQELTGTFEGDTAAEYEKRILDDWTQAVDLYDEGRQKWEQEYAAYKPYEDAYNAALGEYNAYVSAERAEYDRWRGRIRNAEEIRAEQKKVKEARQSLVAYMGLANQYAEDPFTAPDVIAANEARIKELQEYLGGVGEREKLLAEELDWSEHFRFEDLRQNRDFYERSRYREGGGGSLYNQVNTRPGRFHNETFRDDAFAGIYGRMTDQEVDIHNYLHETQGEEAAKEYLAYLTPELNRRKTEEETGAIREWSGRNPINAALATAGSVLLSPLSGIEGTAGMIAAKIQGEEIDPNADYGKAANWKNAARQGVTERIERSLGEFWGPVGSFAYNTGVSMMDMLADSVAGPSAMALIGTRAFSEGTMEAKGRGLDDAQALAMGASAGLAEVLTERIGLDELLHLPDEWADAGFWKGLLRGAAGEAAEEGLTNLANLAADLSIAGDKSEFMQSVHAYREQGMDDEEAVLKALGDAGISLGVDALGGAISGGVYGGWRGYQGKKATEAQEKAEKAAKLAEEPVETADGAAGTVSKMETVDNGTTVPDNGTVREDRTVGNTGKQEATGAKNAQVAGGAVGAENATTAGDVADRNVGETVNENGGNGYGEEAGERVLPGGPERADDAGAGEPVGGYAEHRERQQTEARSQTDAAGQRRTKAENLEKRGHLQRVSSQDLGLRQGTEVKELLELPRIEWDQELYDTATRLEKETGMTVRTVTGSIGVRLKGGGVGLANGYIDRVNKTIVLNVCHSQLTAGQIADHEFWHHKMEAVGRISGDRYEVTRLAAQRIQEQYSPEDFDEVLQEYIYQYRDVYDENSPDFIDRVYEEIMADAYAGMNVFNVEASKFRSTVDSTMDELGMGRNMWNAAEQEDTPAPGGDQRVYDDEDAPPMPEYEDYSQVPEDYDGPEWDHELDFSMEGGNGLEAIEKKWAEQTDYLFLHENRDTVFLDNMVVKEELRDQGIGTKILEDVIAYADARGKTIALTPTSEFGTKKRLTGWYKRFGFVENKGKNTDFRLRDTMYRLPRPGGEDVRFSMDSEGRELSAAQREFFKDSKMLNEHGKLKVMYHGSENAGFTRFMANYSKDLRSFFFTDRLTNAASYSGTMERVAPARGEKPERKPGNMACYLNITNPLYIDTEGGTWDYIWWEPEDPDDADEVESFVWDTRALAKYAKDKGYDGVILESLYDYGAEMDVDNEASTVAIVFKPEQIKSINNTEPTDDPDIRFSLDKPVEETKTLIAMHNLTEEKLEKAIDLGGFPMPSIAVTRADIPHTNFGEITLVMDKGTVDPKADRRNDVFSADAWTPTFPRTEYEANSEVEDRVRRTLQELERKIAPQFQGNLRRVMYGLEDLLNSYDGEENLIAHVLDNDGLKAVYLESQGKHIDEVQVEREVPKRYNQAATEKYEAIIAALGTRDPAEIGTMPLKDIRDNFGAELEKVVPGISKTSLRLSRFMQQTIDYLMDDGSGPETEMVVDQNATRQALEDALDRDGYEAWVRELFSGIEGDKGIYNGKERFTPGGRSRSFQQTHLPVTLDNIVKAMVAQNGGNTKNVSGFNGVKTLRAGTAQRFKSIQGMHDLEGRLQNLTEEEQTALTDGLQHRLYDLIDEIDQEAGRKGTSNNLIRFDQIGQIITEASETGRYNVSDIQKVFRENHQTISDELALKVKELLFDVSQMPVNLFEAKPRRAVRFDEVRAAVVPADTSEELKRKLEEQGVPVIEYERDNIDDRLQKVNSIEDVRFSLDGSLSREEYERLAAEVAGDQSKRNEEFVKSRLTPEQYKQYKDFAREDRMDQEAEARVRGIERFEEAQAREDLAALRAQQGEDAAAGRRELAAEEKAARAEAREKAGTAREERKRKAQEKREKLRQEARERIRRAAENAPADSVPTIARKELQDKLISLFSVGEGQRGELRREIGQLADRMIAEGTVDERDLRRLIDRLYASGVMVIEPEEVYAEGRSYLKDEHIYISPEQIRELGDDWLDLRKKAWGLGVYLTTDRSYAGLDVWNADMASYLPGLFNENETDDRTILNRILQIAEEGKAEKVSLPEYTKRIAKAEHQSEEALLYNMERQVEEALRTFGEKASLEMRLKNRNARRRAMDREEAAIARENERTERERLRQDLKDERAYLKEQNEAEWDRLRLERAENDRRNAAERRRLAEERAERRRKRQEAVRKKELRELQEKTLKALQWISKNRRKAPEAMQEAFTAVLGNIDLYAISMADEMNWSSKYGATWKDLKQMYNHARTADPNFIPSEDLQRIVDRLDSVQLESMDFDQLRDLYQAAVGLRTEFYNRNNVIGSEEHQIMEELYSGCVEEMRTAPKKLKGLLDRFLNLEQLTPMNVFEEMGGFNPDGALYKFAQQLEDGERKVRSFKVRSNKILADFLEDNADWIHRADGQGKDGIWIEKEIPQLIGMKVGEVPEFGGTVKVFMTPMQRVHLYLESRNYDNLRHMTGGRTFADRELYSQGKREEAFAKGTTIRMAPETVQLLVKDMSPEEMELARLLDKYYNDLAATEINKVSNILLGYNKAMGGHYAPIFTNANYTKSEFGKFDGTAEGAGNLKERVKSKNPSYNISALDAFERNMGRTATYVGMAIPVRNWNTLMNWRTADSSFADEITHSWGKGRLDYIQDLITDLQNPMGEQQDMVTEMSGKLLSNYISSVFGFNPSIVVKQLGSIPMASAYLDWKHFPKGVIGKGKIDRELIGRYTQELDWRTMGYSMPETKQLKDAPNWSQKNKVVGLVFGGDAITAMDGWAASVLWPWAENKVRAEFPGLEVGDAAMIESGQSPFYQKVAELFNDAVSRSQSVSDQMHQGRLRKSKHAAAKAVTMFRSDSAQSYNVLRQRLGELDYYRRQGEGGKAMAEAAKKAVGAAATAVLINSIWGTAVDLLVKALKGKLDEEDKEPLQIAEDFFWGVIDSYAGMVTVGDIIAETVGNWFTGEMRFDQEAPGVEQFNDILQAADKIINAGKKGNLIGAIKIAAETVASYGFGLPTKNVEAWLMSLFSFALPGAKVAYEDLLKAPAQADLKRLEGKALTVRLNHVLKGYGVELEPEVREALAALYEAGYTEAVPSAAPDSVTVDGVELELDGRMKKEYDKTRGGIIEQELPEITGSAFFAQADEKTRKAMVTKLYNYAAEKAKEAVLEDYAIGTTAQAIDEIVRSGGSAADYAVFDAVTADMAAWQRAEVLQEWGTDEAVTGLMFKYLVSKSWEDEQAELRKVGVDVGHFLELYAMHGEIDSRDLKAAEKATEFAYWLDGQRYTEQQKAVIKDQMAYFQMMPADASRYNTATAAGLDREQALELTEELDALEPPEGKTSVQEIQKYRVAIDQSVNESNQLRMLQSVGLKDSSYDKVAKGYEMGVAPAAWVRVKEVQQQFDANGNGSMTNAEWEAAIEGICSYGIVLPGDNTRFNLTNEQKAVLWQMMVGKNTKSKNNPFDPAAGQRWRELMGYE